MRALLARQLKTPGELARAVPALCQVATTATVLAVRRAGGAALSAEDRDELLARAVTGQHVELEVDLLAYEQRTGKPNRNFVRVRDGAMAGLGRTGTGRPFLRDHLQNSVVARGGTITASRTEKRGEGDYAVHQTVRLSAPWAVELALRGLLDSVSIGLHPTGPVLCSVCETPIFEACWHCPGETISDQRELKKRDPNAGDVTVEWIFTEAELVETSAVNVPAVPNARVVDVRAALSAHALSLRPAFAAPGGIPTRKENDDMDPELLKLLGLAATATADDVKAAIAKLNADTAELKIVRTELASFQGDISALKADKLKRDEDAFVNGALATGRIGKGDQEHWRALFAADPKRAGELMEKRPANAVTPVGAERQSAGGDPTAPVITGGARAPRSLAQQRDLAIGLLKANPMAAGWASLFGLDPKARFEVPSTFTATVISNNAELEPARIGFHAAFLEGLAGEPDPLMQLATEVPSSKKEEHYSWIGDLPGMQEWKTDRMLKVLEAYGFAIRNKKWEASLRLKNDDIADDALGLLGPIVADMAGNARLHPSILVAHLLLNGFDGTAFPDLGDGLAFDGDFFFSTTHETGSNKLAVAFSAVNLASAAQLLRQQKRFDGGNLYCRGTHLYVGVENEQLAEKILTQEMLAGGESNTQRGKYKLVVSPELGTTWFLADQSGAVRPVMFQNREPLSTHAVGGSSGDSVAFTYDEAWFGAKARYNAGYFDFRRIVGSKP
jgi:phage major head subunit gpT-like protein